MNTLWAPGPMEVTTKVIYEHVIIRICIIDAALKDIFVDLGKLKFLKSKNKYATPIITEAINTGIFSGLDLPSKELILDCFNAIKALEHADYFDFFNRLKIDLKSKDPILHIGNLNTGDVMPSSDLCSNEQRYVWRFNLMHHREKITDKLDRCIKILEQFTSFPISIVRHFDPQHPSNLPNAQ